MAPNEKRGLRAALAAADERIKNLEGEIVVLKTVLAKVVTQQGHIGICPHDFGMESLKGTSGCKFHDENATEEEKRHAHSNCWTVALNPPRKKE